MVEGNETRGRRLVHPQRDVGDHGVASRPQPHRRPREEDVLALDERPLLRDGHAARNDGPHANRPSMLQKHRRAGPNGETELRRRGHPTDSSRPWGDASSATKVLRSVRSTDLVVWDNTCSPAAVHPFDETFPPEALCSTLMLLRSHLKLDQLGLELCAIGSIAALTPPGRDSDNIWQNGLQDFLSDAIGATGACASPATLRLLTALGLPNTELSTLANQRLHRSNVKGAELLGSALSTTGRYQVELNRHECFVEIHVNELAGPPPVGGAPTWPAWDDLDAELDVIIEHAERHHIPIWKSASFGFHYTGLSWFSSDRPPTPHGFPHTVLRVCFGMHDPVETKIVAQTIADRMLAKLSWRTP